MAQPEYREVKPGDWNGVRYAINRANERLSKLDGFCGTSQKHSDTTMMGNQILMGPARQQHAENDEFITKGYLRSKEAADIFSRSVGTGGVAPLILDPSMPGGETITGGGLYNPTTVIRGGDSNSGFANFGPNSGLWIPKYTGDPNTALSFPGDKMVITNTLASAGVYSNHFVGIKSRFRIFPDENGLIEWEVRMVAVYWTNVAASFPYGYWCFGVWPSVGGGTATWIPGLGFGQFGIYSSNRVYLLWPSNPANNTGDDFPDNALTSPNFGVSPGNISIINRHQYKLDTSGGLLGPRLITNQFWNVGTQTWSGSDYEIDTRNMGTHIMNGFNVFIGHATNKTTQCGMQLDEFRLTKGIAYLGASNDTV